MYQKINSVTPFILLIVTLSIISFLPALVYADVTDGLLADFELNGDAIDATGNGFDGTLEGTAPTEDRFGNAGKALYFAGNERVLTGLDMAEEFSVGDPLTFSVWFKTKQNVFRGMIVSGDLPGGGPDFQLVMEYGKIYARLYAGASGITNSTSLNDGQWHHVVWGVGEGDSTFYYIDGEKQTIKPVTGSLARDVLTLGAWKNREFSFVGGIDDFRVYNRGLTPEEVQELYQMEDEKTFEGLFAELLQLIEDENLQKPIDASYDAHLKKVLAWYEAGRYSQVRLQLEAFEKKIATDLDHGLIDDTFASAVGELLEALYQYLEEDDAFPLMTQVVSPYPSLAETTVWSGATYADGRASSTGSCGLTIKECGCVITSFSMLGNYFGVTEGIDGSAVNPLNMDAWLLANDGYTPKGSIFWGKALEYLSHTNGGKRWSSITEEAHYETDQKKVEHALQSGSLAMANSEVGGGHYFLLKEGENNDIAVKDPYWYETQSLNDTKDLVNNVQNYNGTYTSAHVYSHKDKLTQLGKYIELHLASPAELLITDTKGRRLGYNPVTDTYYNEIPNAQYEYEPSIFSSSTPPTLPLHTEKVAYIHIPETTLYTVSVIGTDTGEYTFSTYTRDEDGESEVEHKMGSTTVGEVDTYVVSTEQGVLYDVLKELYDLQFTIPFESHHKYLSTLRVILDKVEKENLTAKENIVEALIKHLEDHYGGEAWVTEVVVLLQAL